MLKKAGLLVAVLGLMFSAGCVGAGAHIHGSIYTDVKGPLMLGDGGVGSKTGTAKATGILFFATGDASIEAAQQQGGIKKVSHVDYKTTNILGLYSVFETTVYGN